MFINVVHENAEQVALRHERIIVSEVLPYRPQEAFVREYSSGVPRLGWRLDAGLRNPGVDNRRRRSEQELSLEVAHKGLDVFIRFPAALGDEISVFPNSINEAFVERDHLLAVRLLQVDHLLTVLLINDRKDTNEGSAQCGCCRAVAASECNADSAYAKKNKESEPEAHEMAVGYLDDAVMGTSWGAS